MRIKDMAGALQLHKKKNQTNQMMTVWGEHLDKNHILEEYPRPQLKRKQYTVLNGKYDYAITRTNHVPENYDGEILVPFSPESCLSGVGRQLRPDEYLWYHRDLLLDNVFDGHRLLLHFGACDERCKVYLNGQAVGGHSGGYQSFTFDITEHIRQGKNDLLICVRDKSDTSYHGRGKQKLQSGGIFYTAQSGIWQTVWMEWVPDLYIEKLYITPLYDEDKVSVSCKLNTEHQSVCGVICIYEQDKLVCEKHFEQMKTEWVLDIPDKKSWSPTSPFLYQVSIRINEDEIESYFGMRYFSVEPDVDGIPRLCLNHVAFFQNGILDQGYWPESLLTPPSDDAMIYDILTAKQSGFSMIRKHCKIEPMRWYYHCDRLGMLVWQDMINGGDAYRLLFTTYIPTVFQKLRKVKDNHYYYMSRREKKGRNEWKKECLETIDQLYNCTCICTWVLFNEGWGQFDAGKNTSMVREKDKTRWIDAHSGWFDQDAGDLKSEHIYFYDLKVEKSKKPFVISEYGGLTLAVQGHCFSENLFGYQSYEKREEFASAFHQIQYKIQMLKREGLCAAVYTQLTDVEEEVNGIMTYDRKVKKIQGLN